MNEQITDELKFKTNCSEYFSSVWLIQKNIWLELEVNNKDWFGFFV